MPRAVTADRGYGEAAVDRQLTDRGSATSSSPARANPGSRGEPSNTGRRSAEQVKWRTGCEGRVSSLKRQYGWDRTRIDSLEGARTWAGQGIFTSNLVKIATLTAPVPLIGTTGGSGANRSSSISTPRARAEAAQGFPSYRRADGQPSARK